VWARYQSMRLSTRLLLIVLTCLVPIMALVVWVEYSHWAERRAQLGDLAQQQAELLNGDIASIADGARVLLSTAAEFRIFRRDLASSCDERLLSIQRDLPMFAFVAVVDAGGNVLCASRPGLRANDGDTPAWMQEAIGATEFSVGRYATSPALDSGFLPFALPVPETAAEARRFLVTGLDLGWLAQHLQQVRQTGSRFLAGTVLSLTDRDGTILARAPAHDTNVGKHLPPAALQMVNAAQSGIMRLRSVDGTERVFGFIPTAKSRYHLMVAIGFYEPDLMTDINRASLRGALLLGIVAIGAFLVTLFVARRFVGRPTRELLEAARRWRAGDLTARAPGQDERSEFGQIATAYNDLARTLARREEELRGHAEAMEARVAERTRELLVTNNRLQVEIAERQNTEAALVQSQKLQAVGQLAGGIAHDFNNLLATVQGSLDLLARSIQPEQKRQRAWIERASGAVFRGAQLTGRLLSFSRRQRLVVEASDVDRLVRDLVPLLRTCTHGQRIRIDTALGANLWPAMVEASQVEAAILNLALNARDAMSDGGVLTIATGNKVVSDQGSADLTAGDYVAITVTDTGVGMTDEVAERAFEPFFTTKGLSGSGLGLSQVFAMVRESGGTVQLVTAPGRGTSLTLLLPRATEMPRMDRPHIVERRPQSKLPVLVADDDPEVLQVTAEMLRQLGYSVTMANCGQEALELLEAEPAIVVLDYAMPSMTGLEVAAAMRARGFAGPIILATGYADLSETEQFELDALQGVLNKPYSIRDLEALMTRVEADVSYYAEEASLETAN
jgi:signal transduction histidine kinase/CheY-like chemotaxis protein